VVEEPLLNLSVHGPKDLMVGDPANADDHHHQPRTGVARNVTIEARITQGA